MRRFLGSLLSILVITLMVNNDAAAADPDDMIYMELKTGRVVIETRPDIAPKHVARIKELVREGFYDGLKFHRVINGFMAQTGDPKGNGTGGSGKNIAAEFSDFEGFHLGTVGMARSQSPNSADSQFFIMFDRSEYLDGKYTIWGEVTEGMEHVDAIKKGSDSRNGEVDDPDTIISMKIASDVK